MKYVCILVICIAGMLSACTSYISPPDSGENCTVTVRDPGRFPHRLAITAIDKASTEPAGGLGGLPPSRFTVSPGRHVFSVRYTMGGYTGFERVEAVLEAKHAYTLCSEAKGTQFMAWFIDDATGARIDQKHTTDLKKLLFGKLAE